MKRALSLKELLLVLLSVISVAGACLYIGWYLGFNRMLYSPTRSQGGPWVDDFVLAHDIVSFAYDGEWNSRESVSSSIEALVKSLGDPYSYYVDGAAYARVVSERELHMLEGLGMVMSFENDSLRVMEVLPGSPAEAVGVMAGELIVRINGVEVREMGSFEVARGALRLPLGTEVVLGMVGENGEEEVRLQVGSFSSVPTSFRKLNEEMGVVKVYRFQEMLASEWDVLWSEIERSQVRGLIIDLRNNSGGNGELDFLEEFVDEGTLFIERIKGEEEVVHVAKAGGRFVKMPVVVLVNRHTASAAEIVASAFQDLGKAVVVGERTLGKDSVGGWFELWSDAGMQLTIGHWLRGDRSSVGGVGVIPDMEMVDKVEVGSDPVLREATGILESELRLE